MLPVNCKPGACWGPLGPPPPVRSHFHPRGRHQIWFLPGSPSPPRAGLALGIRGSIPNTERLFTRKQVFLWFPQHTGERSLTWLHFFLFSLYMWGRKWQPTPAFLPGKSHGQRCLAGCKESDTTERLSTAQLIFEAASCFVSQNIYIIFLSTQYHPHLGLPPLLFKKRKELSPIRFPVYEALLSLLTQGMLAGSLWGVYEWTVLPHSRSRVASGHPDASAFRVAAGHTQGWNGRRLAIDSNRRTHTLQRPESSEFFKS